MQLISLYLPGILTVIVINFGTVGDIADHNHAPISNFTSIGLLGILEAMAPSNPFDRPHFMICQNLHLPNY